MSITIRSKVLTSTLGLMTVLCAAGEAGAAGFQLREQSSEGLGNAFAGATAKAYNLSTIYYNPAGMTRLEGDQVAGSVTWIAPVAKFEGTNTVGGTRVSGNQGGDAIKDAAVGAAYAMWDYRPDLKFGIAITAPFGLRSEYEDGWVGRYHAVESSITNINVTPSVAYRLTDKLSIGGGVQVSYVKARLSNDINMAAIIGAGQPDGRATIEGDDIGFGGDIGFLYEFTPQTRVGLNYRSQVKHELSGDATFTATAVQRNALGVNARNTGASANLTTPDTVTLGVYHEISPQWAVMSDVQWTKWSNFKELRVSYDSGRPDTVVDESWNNTWFFSLGATYTMDEKSKFHFGVAYDQSAVDDQHRTARIPDSDRYWLSLGYSYDFSPSLQTNIGYTYILGKGADINEASVQGSGNLVGSYDAHVNIVSASVVMKF
jgi:long-chain fatty acid transport protein